MTVTPWDDPSRPAAESLAARRKPRVLLEIRRGAARHRLRAVLGPVYLIGGSAECDLVLGDRQFPEIHAYLLLNRGRVLLRHLGNGPEITVNGRQVEAAELLHGDRLRTGPYEFRLHVGVAPQGPARKDAAKDESLTEPPPEPSPPVAESSEALVQSLLNEVRAWLAEVEAASIDRPKLSPPGRNAA